MRLKSAKKEYYLHNVRGLSDESLLSITSNGLYDVAEYDVVDVKVPITKIGDVVYYNCISSEEASVLQHGDHLLLKNKEITTLYETPYVYYRADPDLHALRYATADRITEVWIESMTTGVLNISSIEISSAYLVIQNGRWLLFYNLID